MLIAISIFRTHSPMVVIVTILILHALLVLCLWKERILLLLWIHQLLFQAQLIANRLTFHLGFVRHIGWWHLLCYYEVILLHQTCLRFLIIDVIIGPAAILRR